jgi:predicted acetyltransferase
VQASLRLEPPSRDLRASYRSLIAELEAAGEERVPFPLTYPFEDFDAMLAKLADDSNGIGLPQGFVPNSTFWLVQDKAIVGVSNLRHRLNPRLLREGGNIGYGIRPSARRKGFGREILKQTLIRARGIGLSRALVTCGKQNIGSAKIILSNAGVFESEQFEAERNEIVQRYWIELEG